MGMDSNKQREFVFYLMPEFTLLAFSSAIEALRLANSVLGYELYTWRVVSLLGEKVRASCGVDIGCDHDLIQERVLTQKNKAFMAVVCGGLNIERYYVKQLGGWLRECRQNGIAVASLCTGAHILAKAELLTDKKCVIHWENIPSFSEEFCDALVQAGLYEVDGGVHTCAGGMASFDMMLHIIRQDCDNNIVGQLCEIAIVDKIRNKEEKQRLPFSSTAVKYHPAVTRLIEKMQNSIADPIPVEDLMIDLGLTRRQIERHFRKQMQISPARYYLRLRLDRARLLLEHMNMPIIEIAIASGFSSASHFSKTYREIYGCSPQEVRKKRTMLALDV